MVLVSKIQVFIYFSDFWFLLSVIEFNFYQTSDWENLASVSSSLMASQSLRIIF